MYPTEAVYLSRRDTIGTACELLQNATPGAQVWLVTPWRVRWALELLNLKRLRRTAENAGLDLRLVSRHFHTRLLAREAGIPVYFSVPLRLRRYRRRRHVPIENLRARVKPVKGGLGFWWEHRPRHIGFGVALLSLIVIVGLIGVLLGVTAALMPSAKIILEPIAEPVYASADVTADPVYREIAYGQAIIPARVTQVIVEGHGDTPATGRLDTADGHASGEAVFANRTDGLVTVPKGTIVRTSSGVNASFYTLAEIELPPQLYGHARVGIIALELGPIGNVKALTINIVEGEIAQLVEVLNDVPTEGGTIKRVPIVAYKDFDRLRADLIVHLQQEAYTQLVSELGEGEFVPPDSLKVEVMAQYYDQVVDQRSDVLSMQMKVVARGIAVDGAALKRLAARLLVSGAGKERRLIEDSLAVQISEQVRVEGVHASGTRVVHLSFTTHGLVAPVIDIEQVKKAIRGQVVADATDWLSRELPLRSKPRVTVIPEWWEWMPWLPARVDVIISAGEG